MLSYLKSLLAVALALLSVMGAGLWFQNRLLVLRELTEARNDLKAQLATLQTNAGILADYEKRVETLDGEIKTIAGKFVDRAYEVPQLVKSMVKSASAAGIKLTDASRVERKTYSLPVKDSKERVCVIAHEITLRGSYTGAVKFLQSLASWKIGYKLESVEIIPFGEGAEEGEIEMALVLSVYSLEPLTGSAHVS